MDKKETVYREHSAKEHLFLAAMILLAFFILTSNYNPEILPSGSPTGAAVVTYGPIAIWGLIMLLLILGIIIGIVLWWRNHKKIQVQKALQQDVDNIVKAAGGKSGVSKPIAAVDPLTRKLNKVEQELIDIPLRSAEKGHILKSIPSKYGRVPVKPAGSLRRLLHPHPKQKVHKKLPLRPAVRHPAKHRESFQDKMLEIQKEIQSIKTK